MFFVIQMVVLSSDLVVSSYRVQGEPSFHLFGFIMCISATAARALKTVLQGILLSSEGYQISLSLAT